MQFSACSTRIHSVLSSVLTCYHCSSLCRYSATYTISHDPFDVNCIGVLFGLFVCQFVLKEFSHAVLVSLCSMQIEAIFMMSLNVTECIHKVHVQEMTSSVVWWGNRKDGWEVHTQLDNVVIRIKVWGRKENGTADLGETRKRTSI